MNTKTKQIETAAAAPEAPQTREQLAPYGTKLIGGKLVQNSPNSREGFEHRREELRRGTAAPLAADKPAHTPGLFAVLYEGDTATGTSDTWQIWTQAELDNSKTDARILVTHPIVNYRSSHLIAAAPDLLAALKQAEPYVCLFNSAMFEHDKQESVTKAVLAAIRKAEPVEHIYFDNKSEGSDR